MAYGHAPELACVVGLALHLTLIGENRDILARPTQHIELLFVIGGIATLYIQSFIPVRGMKQLCWLIAIALFWNLLAYYHVGIVWNVLLSIATAVPAIWMLSMWRFRRVQYVLEHNRVAKMVNAKTWFKPDISVVERDDRETDCQCFFGHSSTLGLGEYVTVDNMPTWLQEAIQAHHWCLVFYFGEYKIMLCELDFNDDDEVIRPVYRVFSPEIDERRYGSSFIKLADCRLSPRAVWHAAATNPLNKHLYSVSGKSCQEWIFNLADMLEMRQQLDNAVLGKRRDYPIVNVFIDFAKGKKAKVRDHDRAVQYLEKAT